MKGEPQTIFIPRSHSHTALERAGATTTMADFVEQSHTKTAVRELPVPIADITRRIVGYFTIFPQ
jgi:hypothetical protein